MPTPKPTPRERGYAFPAEWHPHAGTWMSWPRPQGISFPDRYEIILPQLCGVVRAIAEFEPVLINVPDADWADRVGKLLAEHHVPIGRVVFHHIPTNEPWCRDHGPAFLLPDQGVEPGKPPLVVDWGFNAWGGKYPPWDDDDRVPTCVAQALHLEVIDALGPDGTPVIMEGGAVDFNGAGAVLTTTDCLLNPNRNPHLTRPQVEQALRDYYGVKHVCWLTGGIEGDDTDGHIDDLARFVDARTIVVGVEDDPADPNHAVTQDAIRQCRALVDQDGQPFVVKTLPMPGRVEIDGQRLPATYVNFLFVNGGLIVPTYGPLDRDAAALGVLRSLCPGRKVVGVPCDELIWGLGAVHCLTQQMPQT